MAATRHTLSGNLKDQLGALDYRQVHAHLITDADDQVVYDTSAGGAVYVGRIPVHVASTGAFSVSVVDTSGTSTIPSTFQYQMVVEYVDPVPGRGVQTWRSPWFSLTADKDLKDVGEDYVPPTYATQLTAALDAHAAELQAPMDAAVGEAEAARDAAVDISNIDVSDDVVEALIRNTGGAGPKTSGALKDAFVKGINLESWPGVDPNGVTECAAAVQEAIDAAEAAGVPVVAKAGTFVKIATGITILGDCDLSRAVFEYTGTTGTAITVGSTAGVVRKTVKLPFVAASAKTALGWAQVAGAVGVKLVNVGHSMVTIPDSNNFETGVLLYGDGAGCVWNHIELGSIVNNKVNLKFDATGAGYTNQNNFYGGRFNHESAEGSLVSGTRHILMANSPFKADGNNFHGTSLESTGVVEEIIESYGSYNEWRGCRWESVSAPGTKKIHWRSPARGNIIHGGYEAELLTVVADSGTYNNDLRSPFVDASIWIPASAMVLAAGSPTLTQSGGVPFWTLHDGAGDEVSAEVLIPSGWSKVDVSFVWFSTNGAAGNVALLSKTQSHVAGSGVGYGSFAGAGANPAAPALFVSAVTKVGDDVAVTPGPTHFSALRDGTAGADTSAGDIGILGIRLDRAA